MRSVRLGYCKINKLFYVTDYSFLKKKHYIPNKKRISVYGRGLSWRVQDLNNAYKLNEIDFKSRDIFIDVGANNGDIGLWFLKNKKDVFYNALEPSPDVFIALKLNYEDYSNFNVINYAAGNANSSMKFYKKDDSADSSLLEISDYESIEIVKVVKLDDIFKNDVIKCLKVEAEGFEPEVLAGCLKIINNINYITADLGYERGISQKETFTDVTNMLLSKNFKLLNINNQRLCALFENMNYNV